MRYLGEQKMMQETTRVFAPAVESVELNFRLDGSVAVRHSQELLWWLQS